MSSGRTKRPKVIHGFPMEWEEKLQLWVCPLREWEPSGYCRAQAKTRACDFHMMRKHSHGSKLIDEFKRITRANEVDAPTIVAERKQKTISSAARDSFKQMTAAKLEEARSTGSLQAVQWTTSTGEVRTLRGYMIGSIEVATIPGANGSKKPPDRQGSKKRQESPETETSSRGESDETSASSEAESPDSSSSESPASSSPEKKMRGKPRRKNSPGTSSSSVSTKNGKGEKAPKRSRELSREQDSEGSSASPVEVKKGKTAASTSGNTSPTSSNKENVEKLDLGGGPVRRSQRPKKYAVPIPVAVGPDDSTAYMMISGGFPAESSRAKAYDQIRQLDMQSAHTVLLRHMETQKRQLCDRKEAGEDVAEEEQKLAEICAKMQDIFAQGVSVASQDLPREEAM